MDILKKQYWDEINDLVQQHRLPESVKALKLNESITSSDHANTKNVKRVKGGLEVSICLRGGMPMGMTRRAMVFVAVPDMKFSDCEPAVNDFFEDTTKTLEGDDIINIKAEEVEDDDRKIWGPGKVQKAIGPG